LHAVLSDFLGDFACDVKSEIKDEIKSEVCSAISSEVRDITIPFFCTTEIIYEFILLVITFLFCLVSSSSWRAGTTYTRPQSITRRFLWRAFCLSVVRGWGVEGG